MIFVTGRFAWAGLFLNGTPYGASWRGREGGGFLYGSVGPKGLFSGPKNAYIYPDLSVTLVGEFKDGNMVEAKPVAIKEAFFEKFDTIIRLRFSRPANGAFRYLIKERLRVDYLELCACKEVLSCGHSTISNF